MHNAYRACDYRFLRHHLRECIWRRKNDPAAEMVFAHVIGGLVISTHETVETETAIRHWTLPDDAEIGLFLRGILVAWGNRVDIPALALLGTRLAAAERELPLPGRGKFSAAMRAAGKRIL